jgi:glucan endo-1,3-alpha-glucosidase
MKNSEIHLFKDFKYLIAALLLFASTLTNAQTKKVFAHYMVCNRSYGNGSVEGYKQDIQDAQRVGVDGFALNIGGWDEAYQQNTSRLFQAASELGTGFKFFISIDRCCGLSDAQILSMVKAYANHPNHFSYNSTPVLSAWAGGGGVVERDWWNTNILTPLKNSGYNMYFLPFLFTSDFDETPDYNKFLSNYNTWWKGLLKGYFYFGPCGLPNYTEPSILTSGEGSAKVFHENGLTFMGSISPYYWGEKQITAGRRYYEYHGGEGIAAQWKSILEIQKPEWIELTTWNDYGEGSYMSPMDDINKYWPYAGHPQLGFYKTHRGFAELNKYYINWYKTGAQPAITNDDIYFFYRTHPKGLVASNDPQGPVYWQTGDVNDEIHVTTMLPAAAELRVITGGVTKTINVAAGIVHTRIPFNTGAQSFELWRNGVRILQKQGENVVNAVTEYNFNVYSDFASSSLPTVPTPLPPVVTGSSDLVVTGISMAHSNPLPGEAVTFSATLKNQGTVATPEGTIVGVSFAVDNVVSTWCSSYASIPAGASFVAKANGSANGVVTWIATPGNHTIEAFVDDVNRITESNETNNKLSQSYSFSSGTPDLVVTNISYTPANPLPGEAVTFSATIKNQGTAATPDGTIVGVSFAVDNVISVWCSSYASIPAGASFVATANGGANGLNTWMSTSGNHTVEAFVDDVNRVAESNETNNKLSQTYSIFAGTPDLVVTNLSYTPANPLPGEPVTFNATVKNQGNGATDAGTIVGVLFTIDSVTYVWSDKLTSSLDAGASITATANGSPSGPGTWTAIVGNHNVRAHVDDINRIQESIETNNANSQTFTISAASTGAVTGTGLTGQYFDNMDFTNPKLTRTDASINFNWASGSPVSTMGVDQFSVRWTGQIQPAYSERYTFYTSSDDGVRLWINGQQIINNWTDHGSTENRASISLIAGQKYDIKMEYYENGGGAVATLAWSSPRQAKQLIPKTQLYPSAVVAMAAFMEEPEATDETSIYPNPSHGQINIIHNSTQKEEITIRVNDLNGLVVLNQTMPASLGMNQYVLDITKLVPGMYLVSIISSDKKITRKILVN